MFLSHVTSHIILENMFKVLQVLGTQTNEIRVLSDCLTRQFKLVLSLIETINVSVSSSDIILLYYSRLLRITNSSVDADWMKMYIYIYTHIYIYIYMYIYIYIYIYIYNFPLIRNFEWNCRIIFTVWDTFCDNTTLCCCCRHKSWPDMSVID